MVYSGNNGRKEGLLADQTRDTRQRTAAARAKAKAKAKARQALRAEAA